MATKRKKHLESYMAQYYGMQSSSISLIKGGNSNLSIQTPDAWKRPTFESKKLDSVKMNEYYGLQNSAITKIKKGQDSFGLSYHTDNESLQSLDFEDHYLKENNTEKYLETFAGLTAPSSMYGRVVSTTQNIEKTLNSDTPNSEKVNSVLGVLSSNTGILGGFFKGIGGAYKTAQGAANYIGINKSEDPDEREAQKEKGKAQMVGGLSALASVPGSFKSSFKMFKGMAKRKVGSIMSAGLGGYQIARGQHALNYAVTDKEESAANKYIKRGMTNTIKSVPGGLLSLVGLGVGYGIGKFSAVKPSESVYRNSERKWDAERTEDQKEFKRNHLSPSVFSLGRRNQAESIRDKNQMSFEINSVFSMGRRNQAFAG